MTCSERELSSPLAGAPHAGADKLFTEIAGRICSRARPRRSRSARSIHRAVLAAENVGAASVAGAKLLKVSAVVPGERRQDSVAGVSAWLCDYVAARRRARSSMRSLSHAGWRRQERALPYRRTTG
jgi:hypothetical protein